MCNCRKATLATETFTVKYTDGSVSPATYTDETSARLALARSGKSGRVERQVRR